MTVSLNISLVHEACQARAVTSLYGTAGTDKKLRVSLTGYGDGPQNRIAAARSVWLSFLYVKITDAIYGEYYLNKLSLCKRLTGRVAAPGLCSFFSRIFLQLKILFSNQEEIIRLLRPPLVVVPYPAQSICSSSAAAASPLSSDSDVLIQEIRKHRPGFNQPELQNLLNVARRIDQVAAPIFSPPNANCPHPTFTTLSSRSVAVEEIGRGAFKTVYLALRVRMAENQESVSLAALTRCSLQELPERDREVQFRELGFLRALQGQKNIVQMESSSTANTEVVSILDYYNRGDLLNFITSCRAKIFKNTNIPSLINIARDCASGLAEVHEAGIVHGDIKPANILLRELSSGKIEAALTDFGLAYTLKDLEEVGDIGGTTAYLSPEKARAVINKRSIQLCDFQDALSYQSDVWSLGMIFYTLFSGRTLAHYGGTIREIAAVDQTNIYAQIDHTPRIFHSLKGLLKSMLSVDPTLRPTARAVHRQLQLLLTRA